MRPLLAALAGCYSPPPLQPLAPGLATVSVEVVARLPVPAHGATDVRALADGDVLVLQDTRLWRLDRDGADLVAVDLAFGPATRMAPAGEGTWLVGPDAPLRRVGEDGAILEKVDGDGALAIGVAGGRLRFTDREGHTWAPDAAAVPLHAAHDAASVALVDLAPRPGGWFAVDAAGARVLLLDDAGAVTRSIGRFGTWAGALAHPKSALSLDADTVLVGDTDLDALQAFDAGDGRLVGLLATSDGPLRPDHPIAVRPGHAPDEVLVLDAAPTDPAVLVVRLPGAALAAARETSTTRRLRTVLREGHDPDAPSTCIQCHDGLVRDGRAALDPGRAHHPRDVRLEGLAIDGLSADGTMDCGTCHTPHAGGDAFLRRDRAEDGLCGACHSEDPHSSGVSGEGAHPSGAALRQALAARGEAGGDCLTCHTPHAAVADPLLRSLDGEAACSGCHADRAVTVGSHPRAGAHPRVGATAPVDAHGQVTCRSCHTLTDGVGPALLRSRDGGCVSCHDAVAHGRRACLDCHAVHDAQAPDALLATHPASGDARGCSDCHAGPGQEAGHPVASARPDPLDCETCHAAHAPAPSKTCAQCHEEQGAAGGHGRATCLDCHPAHTAGPADRPPGPEQCLACHGPSGAATLLATWTHPTPLFEDSAPGWPAAQGLTFYDDHGAPVAAGQPGALTCASCHTTHGPEGRDHLRRDGWKPVCASCHGAEALLLYRGFHEARP